MDIVFWMSFGFGILLALLSLLGLGAAALVERSKSPADRVWAEAMAPFWQSLTAGLLLIGLALLWQNPEQWFAVIFTPFAVVAALACVMILVADMRAAQSDGSADDDQQSWRALSRTWNKRGTTAMSLALAICFFYWMNHVSGKLEELSSRVKSLEGRPVNAVEMIDHRDERP